MPIVPSCDKKRYRNRSNASANGQGNKPLPDPDLANELLRFFQTFLGFGFQQFDRRRSNSVWLVVHLRFMNNQPDGIGPSSVKLLETETEESLKEAQKLISKIWIRQRLITLSIGGCIAAVAIALLVATWNNGHSEFKHITTANLG